MLYFNLMHFFDQLDKILEQLTTFCWSVLLLYCKYLDFTT